MTPTGFPVLQTVLWCQCMPPASCPSLAHRGKGSHAAPVTRLLTDVTYLQQSTFLPATKWALDGSFGRRNWVKSLWKWPCLSTSTQVKQKFWMLLAGSYALFVQPHIFVFTDEHPFRQSLNHGILSAPHSRATQWHKKAVASPHTAASWDSQQR